MAKQEQKKKGNFWDTSGIVLSGLCVLHCIAVPIVLFLFPTVAAQFLPSEDGTHAILLGFILGVAGVAFVSGFRVHGKYQPIIWMAIGMSLIFYATYFAHDDLGHVWEPILAIVGSLALIQAHRLNHVHCQSCGSDLDLEVKTGAKES
ncbi:MerC domain-containing protein [Bdellovibrionales bacterium]|nr:MerC domain-containing protein [Bdellovibrionales bacterium]